MLKLTFSPASPYVRKVLLSAYRAGIQDEIELVEAGATQLGTSLAAELMQNLRHS